MIFKPLTDKQRQNYIKGSVADFVLLYQTKVFNELQKIKKENEKQPVKELKKNLQMMQEEAEWNISNVYYCVLKDCIKDKKPDMDMETVQMVANNLLFDWKLSDWLFLKKQINY
tara:strand:+ start:192 stop:533 length:342 start_codon:yes stop_codon:yes gene_type:complete